MMHAPPDPARFGGAPALLLCLMSGLAAADAPSISVGIDTSFALSVLDEACSGRDIDEASIRASPTARLMIEHFLRIRDDFTMDAYVDGTPVGVEKGIDA